MAKRILLVDDEPLILKGLKYTLEQEGYETDSAMDGEEALAKFFGGQYDMILLGCDAAQAGWHQRLSAHPGTLQRADYHAYRQG